MVKFTVNEGLKHHVIEAKAIQFQPTEGVRGEFKLVRGALPLENRADFRPFHHLVLEIGEL